MNSQIVVTIRASGARVDTLANLLPPVVRGKYPKAVVDISRETLPQSRAQRFARLQSWVEDAAAEAESLRDELQSWLDALPESLQGSNKADMLQEAIYALDSIVSNLEDAASNDVTFPGMYE